MISYCFHLLFLSATLIYVQEKILFLFQFQRAAKRRVKYKSQNICICCIKLLCFLMATLLLNAWMNVSIKLRILWLLLFWYWNPKAQYIEMIWNSIFFTKWKYLHTSFCFESDVTTEMKFNITKILFVKELSIKSKRIFTKNHSK